MINANEIYENNNKDGKSPGQWLSLKATKKIIEAADLTFEKTEDCYLFDKQLAFHYAYHLNPLDAYESLTEVKIDTPEVILEQQDDEKSDLFFDLFAEVLNASILPNFTIKMQSISGMDIKQLFKNSKGPVRNHLVGLAEAFDNIMNVKVSGANGLKQKVRSASQHIPTILFNSGETLFEDKKFEYYLSKVNKLNKRDKK